MASERVVLAAVLFASAALIGPFSPRTARADVRTEARQHFRRGMELVSSGQLDAGIAELEQAYEILPHPNVLYNLGRACAEGGRYEDAIEYFERYLLSDPVDREEVAGYVAALEERLDVQARRPQEAETTPSVDQGPTNVSVEALRARDVTEEQIRALEESAQQIEAMAEATDSENLHARAERLRQLARDLETSRAAATAASTESRAPAAGADEDTAAEREGALGMGAERADVFEESVVSASRIAESPLDAPNSTTTITAQDIRLSGITDIAQLLRRVAGVDVITHAPGHTDLAIRGLATRQANKVLVLLNGRTLRIDFLGSPFLSILPVNVQDIDRIEVIRGPAAAVYGADAFSGIVNIITREPGDGTSRVYFGAGNANQIEGDASVTGRVDRLSYRFGAGYQQANNYSLYVDPARVDVHTFNDNSTIGRQNLYANGDLRVSFGRGNVLRLGSAISNAERASLVGLGTLRQSQVNDIVFSQTHAQLNTRVGLGARVYWNTLSGNYDVYASPNGSYDTASGIRTDVLDAQLDFNRSFHLLFDHNFTLGGGYRLKSADVDLLRGELTENHYFFFVQDAMKLHERLRATASFRADSHPLFGLRFSPRGSLVYRFVEGQSLRLTAGTAFRSPSFIESYLDYTTRTSVRAVSALGLGNPDLEPEQMISMEAGYQNQATDFFALEANVYYNIVKNEIQLNRVDSYTLLDFATGAAGFDDGTATFPIGSTTFQNQPTSFRQIGGEVGVRVFPVSGLDMYANYAYHDTSPIDASQLPEVRRSEQRTPRHKVNFGVQYRSSFGLDLSVDLHVVTKALWVEQVTATGATTAAEAIRFVPFPLDGYQLLNARVGYRLFDDRLELGVVGYNLLFQEHRQHPTGQTIDTRVLGQTTVRF